MTSTSERQAAYRARRATANQGEGERRLNTWISTKAGFALERLAAHHGISKRAMIERLILEADEAIQDSFEFESPEWDRYFDRVTQ